LLECQPAFQANFKISHTDRPQATLSGTIYYKHALGKFRLNYDSGQVEWYDASKKERVRRCGDSCVTIPFYETIPQFFLEQSDVFTTEIIIEQRSCRIYNKAQTADESLQWVAVDPNNANTACGALLKNGIQFTFINVDATPDFSDSEVTHNCQLNSAGCNSQLDVYFVGDESGSVTQNGFNAEITFMKDMLARLDVRPGFVHAGLTFFSDTASLVQELTGDKTRLDNTLDAKTWKQGKTCVSCGLNMASLNFEGGVSRNGVPKLYVCVTDGKNNMPEPQSEADKQLVEASNRAKAIVAANKGAVVAIGVGNDYNITELRKFATKEKFILQIGSFDALKEISNEVISSSCEESDYICDSCSAGFCLCGRCLGCPGGCPGDDTNGIEGGIPSDTTPYGLIAALAAVGGLLVIGAAVAGVIFFLKKKKDATPTDGKRDTEETKRGTVEEKRNTRESKSLDQRSERYSKLVRKFSEPPVPDTLKRDTKE